MDADGMKADDLRFIHRSSVTGEIVSEEYALANPDTTEKEIVVSRSPWMKQWIEIGEDLEFSTDEALDTHTINAVIHAQVLKRVD